MAHKQALPIPFYPPQFLVSQIVIQEDVWGAVISFSTFDIFCINEEVMLPQLLGPFNAKAVVSTDDDVTCMFLSVHS